MNNIQNNEKRLKPKERPPNTIIGDGYVFRHIPLNEAYIHTEQKYITINECAEMLKVSRQTVYKYLRVGKLKGKLIGTKFMVSKSSIGYFTGENK